MGINLDKVKVGDTVYFMSYGLLKPLEVFLIGKKVLTARDDKNNKYQFTRSEYKAQWDVYGNKSYHEYLTNYDENDYKRILELKQKESDLLKFKAEIKEFCFNKGLLDFDTFKKIYEIITEVK